MSDTNEKINETEDIEKVNETESEENAEESTVADKVSEEDIKTASEAAPDDIKEAEPFDLKNEIIEWLESFVFALLIVQLVFIFVFRIVMVDGCSMNDTLVDHDRLIMTHVNYTPKRDDIVVIDSEKANKILIKRVIGVAGDKVVIDYNVNHVYVNDQEISNEHIKEIMIDNPFYFDPNYRIDEGKYEYDVPEGEVFVMGDNRNDSKDSRSIGTVPVESLMGKAVFRIYPLNKFGPID